MKRGCFTLLVIWWFTFAITLSPGLALIAVVIALIVLPPKYDPAIQIKEAQIKAGHHPEA